MLNLNINEGNFSLRSYLNLENDFAVKQKNDPRLRFYNLYFEARKIFNIATVKLGRQPIFNSVAGGVFDGAYLEVKPENYRFFVYYGGNVPAYQKLEITDKWEDDYILGGKFSTSVLKNFQLGVSYIKKNFRTEKYFAARLGTDLNPVNLLIENNSNQYQFVSGEISYELPNTISINTRYDYDLNFEKTSKFEIDGNYEPIDKLNLNVYYQYREPRIRYNSIFSVFDYGNTQEVEVGGVYKFSNMISALARFANVTYKDDESQRFTAGLVTSYGTLTYRRTFGYAGELDAVSLFSGYTFLEGFLTPSVGVSFTSYKLSKTASEKNSLTTILAGVNIRPLRILSFDLQGQFLNNKIYKNDFRMFFKINYWFNTNLDMM
ncbi:MAG: hypothetical protein HXY49_09930 [Ignavibacteriaceae bacterium]|nr:hypothetical protein [Ignavibacteriaceae bacterium]